MKLHTAAILTLCWFLGPDTALCEAQGPEQHWPSFRGSRARGVQEGYATPVTWNADASEGKKVENVLWKTAIPGLGHSSPVIWDDRLFVTTALSDSGKDVLRVGLYGSVGSVDDSSRHTWKVYCLDRNTGKVLWKRTAHRGVPEVKRHPKATHANCTMALSGRRAVAFFGSEGLYCYDMNGKLRWKKDLGVLDSGFHTAPSAQWGFGSSPVIHDGTVIVQCDVQEDSFLAAFSLENGREIWRTPRDEVPTWGTPTIHEVGDRALVLVNGWMHIGGYDAKTGKEVWRLEGGGDIPVPTPVVAHGLVFITNAHGGRSPIYAVRLTASGDLEPPTSDQPGKHLAWFRQREGSYLQTPLVYGDHLYVCQNNGVLACFEARTGKRLYKKRLGSRSRSGFSASAVAADGKVYYTRENGEVFVLKAGPEFEVLATNHMGEVCMATPALCRGTLFIRTRGHVVAISDMTDG